jgi:hypothetical protein
MKRFHRVTPRKLQQPGSDQEVVIGHARAQQFHGALLLRREHSPAFRAAGYSRSRTLSIGAGERLGGNDRALDTLVAAQQRNRGRCIHPVVSGKHAVQPIDTLDRLGP